MHGALLGRRAGLSWENRDAFRVPSLGAVLPFGSCGAGCEDGTWGQRGPQSSHPAVLGLLKGRMQPGRCGVHGALLAAGGRSGTAREAAFPAAMPSASSRGHWRPGNEAGALGSILHAPPFPSLPPRPNTETRFCSSSVSLSVVSRVHVSAHVCALWGSPVAPTGRRVCCGCVRTHGCGGPVWWPRHTPAETDVVRFALFGVWR